MRITVYCIHNIFIIRVHHFCYCCIIRKNISVHHMTSALQCIVCMIYKCSYPHDLQYTLSLNHKESTFEVLGQHNPREQVFKVIKQPAFITLTVTLQY